MKQTITLSMFRDGFKCRPDNFSYEGLETLFNYYEELEQDMREELEFDPIAICCEFTESTIYEALEAYSLRSVHELEDNTTVLHVAGDKIIFKNY